MGKSKDILVGYTVNIDSDPTKITQSFDGENEGVDYSKLTQAFSNLKSKLQQHNKELFKEPAKLGCKQMPFTD